MADTVTQVAPGIFQLRVPIPDNPLGYTLSYLATGPEGAVLVDTGMRTRPGIEALRDQLTGQLGIKQGSVKLILITHNHPDHAGLAREAKDLTGARIAMHRVDWETMNGMRVAMQPGGIDRIRAWYHSHGVPPEETAEVVPHRVRRPAEGENPHAATAHGAHSQGDPHAAQHSSAQPPADGQRDGHGAPEPPDVLLEGGETFSTGEFELEAVWTPGHTPGHLCFYDRRHRYLFTGDHILPIITSNVSLFLQMERSPLDDYLSSVRKVAGLDVGLVLPAHEHHFTDLPGRVSQLEKHHEARLDAVLRGVSNQPRTAYEVAAEVPWDVGSWEKMDAALRRAAVGETLSHLAYLQRQSKVEVHNGGAQVRFALMGAR